MEDITLKCAKCGSAFVWTAGEQRFYKDLGLNSPRNCKPCRELKRHERQQQGA